MTEFMQEPVVQALAWALVHFVWQGAAIGLAAYVAFRVVRTSASARYAIGVGALMAMLAAPAATFVTLVNEPIAPPSGRAGQADDFSMTISAGPGTVLEVNPSAPEPRIRVDADWRAIAVVVWFAGVALFSVRLFGGWIVARRYARRAVRPASDHIQALARQLADRLAVRRVVSILQSHAVAVPVLIGWLKPTIVFPVAALAGLSPTQVEALLAHELAHVRRHDYLVNLLQSVSEALLFYHPAVWWLSRRVRAERELCCDDLAVSVCDRLVYATALTDLAAMAAPGVALAATDGNLLVRVRRILGHDAAGPAARTGMIPVLALALVAGIVAPVALASPTPEPAATPAAIQAAALELATPPLAPVDAAAPQTPPQTTLPQTTSPQATQQATQQAEQQRIEEIRRRYEDMQKELIQLQVKRAMEAQTQAQADVKRAEEQVLEAQDKDKQVAAAQAARAAEIEAARKAYEDAKKRYEAGLISESQMIEARTALAKAEAKGDTAAMMSAELQEAIAKLARSRMLVERGLLAPNDTAQLEATIKALEQQLAHVKIDQEAVAKAMQSAQIVHEKGLTDANSARQLYELLAARGAINGAAVDEKAIANAIAAATARMDEAGAALAKSHLTVASGENIMLLPHLEPSAPVQAGDLIRITITGEPDLPAMYRVAEEGTIRLPFVGAIKVAGLNTAQVREAVGKQLASKKLGSVDQVTVSVARPGTIKRK